MALSKENADFIVDMGCTSDVLASYDSIIKTINRRLETVDARSRLLTPQVWSGDGRVSFNQAMDQWIKDMLDLLEQIQGTRDSLEYLLEEADPLREKAEQFMTTII